MGWVYIIKRLLLVVPTLFFILLANFFLVQLAPGGPVEQAILKMEQENKALIQQGFGLSSKIYQASGGLSQQMADELSSRFGFDLPWYERLILMLKNYAQFNLGDSFFQGKSVAGLILEKLPVSLAFGSLCLLVMYGFGVALGVYQAWHHGTKKDHISLLLLAILHALPVFMVAVFLLLVFAGSSLWQIFPIQGMTSPNFEQLSWMEKLLDLLWHLTLPVLASSLGSIAGIAYLTKFSVMSEKRAIYVTNLRLLGFKDARIFYGNILKNACLPLLANLPLSVVGLLFSGNFLVEVIFGIDGMGKLSYEALVQRDYPVIFGSLFVFSLLGIVVQLIFDILYQLLDPRLDFGASS